MGSGTSSDLPSFTGFDAGLWLRERFSSGATGAVAGGYTLGALAAPAARGDFECDDFCSRDSSRAVPRVFFIPVALGDFNGWLDAEIRRLTPCDGLQPGEGTPRKGSVRCFPRLELPTAPASREFLKTLDHERIAAWLTAQEAAWPDAFAQPWLVRAGDYNRAALELRKLMSEHRDRSDPAQRYRLALILDDFGTDDAEAWPAAMRLGVNQPVYLLARGLPGVGPADQGRRPEALSAAVREQAETLYHHAVGELGTERILFGSGLAAGDPGLPGSLAALAASQAALAAWFRAPREWLDEASVELIFGANFERMLQAKLPAAHGTPTAAAAAASGTPFFSPSLRDSPP